MKLLSLFVLLFILSSCSRKSDAELYNEAKSAYGEKDFPKAAQLYENIVEKFPKQAYAESSLIHLAFMYNNDIKDAHKAIHAYQRFYEMFPSSKQAPTMFFLSGFLYNNELHIFDSARIVYETFLQKFPDHELATSAKFELETLGKDPGQALNPKVTTEDSKSVIPKKVGRK